MSKEFANFERNLSQNLYRIAFDILRKRFVYINDVVKDEKGKLVVLVNQKDGSMSKYSPNELSKYGF